MLANRRYRIIEIDFNTRFVSSKSTRNLSQISSFGGRGGGASDTDLSTAHVKLSATNRLGSMQSNGITAYQVITRRSVGRDCEVDSSGEIVLPLEASRVRIGTCLENAEPITRAIVGRKVAVGLGEVDRDWARMANVGIDAEPKLVASIDSVCLG